MMRGRYIAIPLTIVCGLLPFQRGGSAAHGAQFRAQGVYRGRHGAPAVAGGALTWGGNNVGQLGTGRFTYSNVPVSVLGLSNVRAVAAARLDSSALTRDGAVWAWGWGGYGTLGADASANQLYPAPVRVRGLPPIATVATGDNSTVALARNGTVWAWGESIFDELGTGDSADGMLDPRPTAVRNLANIVAVAVGVPAPYPAFSTDAPKGEDKYLALRRDGSVWTWGQTPFAPSGSEGIARTPVPIPGLRDVVGIALGSYHGLALRRDGTVWGWAEDDGYGQMGTGVYTTTPQLTPARVPGLTDVIAIAAAGFHNLALTRDGTVWAWGLNVDGTLGIGVPCRPGQSFTSFAAFAARCIRAAPTRVARLRHVVAIATGTGHNLALEQDGTAWAWDANNAGQLGAGISGGSSATPVRVRASGRLIAIAVGDAHSIAVRAATR